MKKAFSQLIILLSFFTSINAQTLTVSTFNLRYDNKNDVGNLWKDRSSMVTSLIRFHDFDVVGTQEGLKNQLDDIQTALPEYVHYGIGRDDGKDAGEHSAIFYKKDEFTLLKSGDFWLSETPDKPGLGWDATCCNRICSWVYLQDKKTKNKFYFFNTHFDHQGVIARVESSKLILSKVKSIAGNEPVILTGDFNGDRNTEWYQGIANSVILRDSHNDVTSPYDHNTSFHDFGKLLDSNSVIDHIFITPKLKAESWGILTDSFHGKYPSDHFPVMARIRL